MALRRVALIIFYDKQKQILLQNRKSISKLGEEWGFFGGKIEERETPDQALKREVKEELTYDLHIYKFLCVSKQKITSELELEGHIFIAPLGDKLSHFKLKEGDGWSLFSCAEAKKLKMVQGDDKIIEMVENVI